MSTQTLMTVEQFAQLNTAECQDFELVEGELIPLASPTPRHAWIRDEIRTDLALYLRQHPVGIVFAEVDCLVGEDTVRRPDVSFFAANPGRTAPQRQVPVPFAPDIAVEVLSPSETAVQVNRRVLDYIAAGTKEVWVVDHENFEVFVTTAEGIRLLRANDAITSPLLEGFRLPVAQLLAE